MTTDLTIRSATSDDASAVLACLHEAFEPYRQFYSAEGFRDTTLDHATVHERLREMRVLVGVTKAGEVVGTVGGSANGAEGHIRGMAVRPQWGGAGVAQRLLDAIEAELRVCGCIRVTLDTTEPLQRAMRFYERNNYLRSGKVGDFFGMPLIEYAKLL
jgi:GNAT superfamily N-acetyltransferase